MSFDFDSFAIRYCLFIFWCFECFLAPGYNLCCCSVERNIKKKKKISFRLSSVRSLFLVLFLLFQCFKLPFTFVTYLCYCFIFQGKIRSVKVITNKSIHIHWIEPQANWICIQTNSPTAPNHTARIQRCGFSLTL